MLLECRVLRFGLSGFGIYVFKFCLGYFAGRYGDIECYGVGGIVFLRGRFILFSGKRR